MKRRLDAIVSAVDEMVGEHAAGLAAEKDRYDAEEDFAHQCRFHRLPAFEREVFFAQQIGRKWRFDFAWRFCMVAVEIEGIVMRKVNGIWQMGGAHGSIKGFKEDCIKYNTAALLGWTVLRFEQSMVRSEHALGITKRMLSRRGWKQKS